jgi:hypothetical protein
MTSEQVATDFSAPAYASVKATPQSGAASLHVAREVHSRPAYVSSADETTGADARRAGLGQVGHLDSAGLTVRRRAVASLLIDGEVWPERSDRRHEVIGT